MKKLMILSLTAILFAGAALTAQEENGRGRRRRSNMNTAEWTKVQSELKEKDPAAYQEIQKLAATNIFEAMVKFREAAGKNNIKMPSFGGGRRRSEGMDGDRPDSGGRERGGDRPDFRGDRSGFGGRGMNSQNARKEALDAIKAKDPAGYKKYEEMVAVSAKKDHETMSQKIETEKYLSSLASKVHATLPETMESQMLKMRFLREKYKAEFESMRSLPMEERQAKLEALAKKEGFSIGKMPMRFGGPHGGNFERQKDNVPEGRGNPMAVMRKLRAKYPEEMKKIRELQKTDPAAANAAFRELRKKAEAAEK